MRKFTSFVAFFVAAGLAATVQAADLYVVARDAQGNVVNEAKVNVESTLNFTGTAVEVRSPQSLLATFPYENVSAITFRYGDGAGVGALKVTNNLRLRENPVQANLEIAGFEGEPVSLTVFDSKGGVVLKRDGWNGENVNVSSLAPGLYFVTVNKTTLKFIKK